METKFKCSTLKSNHDKSCIQAFYIGILNKFYDIRIQKPNLKKMKSFPFLTILSIQTDEDEIFLSDYIETRCEKHFVDRKTQKNVVNETLMFLLDAIEMKNYWFHSSIGKKHVDEDIVYINDFLSSSDIIERGADINGYICDAFNSEDEVLFERNHSFIQDLVGL